MLEDSDLQIDLASKINLTNGLDNCAQELRSVATSTLDLLRLLEESVVKIIDSIDTTRVDLKEFLRFLQNSKQQENIFLQQLSNDLCMRYLDFYTTKLEVLEGLLENLKNTEL